MIYLHNNGFNVNMLLKKCRAKLLLCIFFLFSFLLSGCHYAVTDQSIHNDSIAAIDSSNNLLQRSYSINTNLELWADSFLIEELPIKDSYFLLEKGKRVVVAEIAVHPTDTVDSIWVKLAHSQEVQGWVRESELIEYFVPTDSISETIYLLRNTYAPYFIIVFAVLVIILILRAFSKRKLRSVYFNDIDSIYPLLLCFLISMSATLYESMQLFVPETWEHFYFNPTLSPFKTPLILSLFLLCIWASVIVFIAVIDDSFKLLLPTAAVFYMLGLFSACIFCYFFFIYTTHYYVGYLLLLILFILFIRKVYKSLSCNYVCGNFRKKIKDKGICPYCGADNQ